jgi:hypothetical protein
VNLFQKKLLKKNLVKVDNYKLKNEKLEIDLKVLKKRQILFWVFLKRFFFYFLVKQYTVDVYTGDKSGCGTNANVFCTIYGDKGDTGERELAHSETHRDKFEKNHQDRFKIECADLGNIYKLKIRHDNSGLSPDWLLARVEVIDGIKTYLFYCEQWLAKGKGDSKIERTLYEKVN